MAAPASEGEHRAERATRATATSAASSTSAPKMVRRRTPTKRITAASIRRSSTLSSMMQSRKTALATMVMTAIARWKRLTTRKVWDDSEAMAAEGWARKPKALAVERGDGAVGRHAGREPDAEPVHPVGGAEQSRRGRAGAGGPGSAWREISAGSGRGS